METLPILKAKSFFEVLFRLKGEIFITAGQRPEVMKILPFRHLLGKK
jgi:hypothetical protein